MKRVSDISLAVLLFVPVTSVLATLFLLTRLIQPGPFLHISDRVGRGGSRIRVYKLRTMDLPESVPDTALGGDTLRHVTPLGRVLRRTRLDELPQLVSVLSGEMSFVGPRPPLRKYVSDYPEIYGPLLRNRPGITGLATVLVCAREERILARCRSATETDAVYRSKCIPAKTRIDKLYSSKQSLGLDFYVLYLTLARFMPLPGRRARRLRDERRALRRHIDYRAVSELHALPQRSGVADVHPAS